MAHYGTEQSIIACSTAYAGIIRIRSRDMKTL